LVRFLQLFGRPSPGRWRIGIISLLPVELILQVGSASGFAMVFALLIAAIIWNLGTR
jgi:PiT family inorganic phosphate transporter